MRGVKMSNESEFLNLKNYEKTGDEQFDMDLKKKITKALKDVRQKAKPNECCYCGKTTSSLCNSHTLPKFILKNIAIDGETSYINSILEMDILSLYKGINQSGIFNMICKDCDSTIFRDYEDEKYYTKQPTTKMLAQIDMKSYLSDAFKKREELEIIKLQIDIVKDIQSIYFNFDDLIKPTEITLKMSMDLYLRAKESASNTSSDDYVLLYYQELNYITPVAFQGHLTLIFDFDGNVINNIYNFEGSVENITLCIFPINGKTTIMVFVDKNNKRYDSFFKQFNEYDLEQQLKIINYILFLYSEEYFLYKGVAKETLSKLQELVGYTTISFTVNKNEKCEDTISNIKENYMLDLSKINSVPNILSEQFKV